MLGSCGKTFRTGIGQDLRTYFEYERHNSVFPASGGLGDQSRAFVQASGIWNDECAKHERLTDERKRLKAQREADRQRGHQR